MYVCNYFPYVSNYVHINEFQQTDFLDTYFEENVSKHYPKFVFFRSCAISDINTAVARVSKMRNLWNKRLLQLWSY